MGRNAELYEHDFYTWTQETAALIAAGKWHEIDQARLADPPQGERRYLDLVARVPVLQAISLPRAEPPESWIALVHVEIESAETVAPFRPRMFEYDEPIRGQYGVPVLPIGLYVRVGLQGIGWDTYEEHFWEHRLVRFDDPYIGLPALPAEPSLQGNNW